MIRLTYAGLVATEVMPGIDPQRDIVDASKGRVSVAAELRFLPACPPWRRGRWGCGCEVRASAFHA